MAQIFGAENYRVMELEQVLYDLANSSPTAVLIEKEAPFRKLEIPVALIDAQNLRHVLAGTVALRPTTSELLSSILERTNLNIIDARIVRIENGIYFSELDVMTTQGRQTFDCRTSDALALVQRQRVPAPILCADSLLD